MTSDIGVPEKTPANRGELRVKRRKMSVEQRRHQIVVAGARLFADSGYSTVSMDDIATHVGVSKPTLYYYFGSKQDILEAIFREVADHVHSRFDAREAAGSHGLDQVEGVIRDLLDMHELLPGYQRVYLHHLSDLSDDVREWVVESRASFQRRVRSALQEAMAAGDVDRSLDVRLVSQIVFGMGSYSYQWWDPDVDDAETASALFARALVRGIRADAPERPEPDSL